MAESVYPATVLKMISGTFLSHFLFAIHFPSPISFPLFPLPYEHYKGFVFWTIVFPPPLRSMASMHLLRFRKPKVTRSLSQTSLQLCFINESQDNWYLWWHRCLIFEITVSSAVDKAFLLCSFRFLFTPHWPNLSSSFSLHFGNSVAFSVCI